MKEVNRRVTLLVVLLIVITIISFKVGMHIGDRILIDSKYRQVTIKLNEYNEQSGILNRFEEEEVRDDRTMLEFIAKLDNPIHIQNITMLLSHNVESVFSKNQNTAEIIIEGRIEDLKPNAVYVKKMKETDINKIKYINIFILSFIVALIFSQLENKYIIPTIILMSIIGIMVYINVR